MGDGLGVPELVGVDVVVVGRGWPLLTLTQNQYCYSPSQDIAFVLLRRMNTKYRHTGTILSPSRSVSSLTWTGRVQSRIFSHGGSVFDALRSLF